MRIALPALLLVSAIAAANVAADPLYLDQLMETPLATLQAQFPDLKREGCYAIGDGRYVLLSIDKKAQKPWRVVVTTIPPCRKPKTGPVLDLQERAGVKLGDRAPGVIASMGRPDAAAPPDAALKALGETEYFYICRVEEGCARHTSVIIKDGVVTAIAEWYSE